METGMSGLNAMPQSTAPLIPSVSLQRFSSLLQLPFLQFRLVMGSQTAEHPGGSEDGELSSAVLGPPGTNCRRTRLIYGRHSSS